MAKTLVIVESPTKARTIEKFLGSRFEVAASYGHVRDLPNNASEIPSTVKKEKWSRLGINVDKQFEPLYIVPSEKKKRVNELKALLKKCDELLLATDEDREGESISWHLLEILKPKVPTKRLVFHEITKHAINEALSNTRQVDENLVRAQETRRLVDRLFGYSVSPLLWKKMAPRLSAGRVQSVALRLLVERERERIRFREASYWDLKALVTKQGTTESFEAELTHVDSKRIAIGKDFDPNTGKLFDKAQGEVVLLDEKGARALREKLLKEAVKVASIEEKPFTQRPSPPFVTSTLQQEAVRKLGFSARRTMQVAQNLYENGFITYMRTDSTSLSNEAIRAARNLITEEFGQENLHPEPRIYKTKVKNAQEAHEAIRPAGAEFVHPRVVRERLGVEAFRLYELIWQRTVACQMKDARGTRVAVQLQCDGATFRASGKTIEFPGYLRAYVESSEDPESDLAEHDRILPKLTVNEALDFVTLDALGHVTQPPARYTEGSLIKELERLGIGRPSTWATIVDVVLSRTYAFKKGPALVPTFLAMAVIGLMEGSFSTLVNYEFTARLEDDLDAISRGESDNLKYLNTFYFGNGHPGLKNLIEQGEEQIDPRLVNGIPIGTDSQGRPVEVRVGRFGPFITNGETRASLPEDMPPDELSSQRAEEILKDAAKGPEVLGVDPQTGQNVYVKNGRFGTYLQLGEQGEDGEKPRMASLLPGMSAEGLDLDTALKLLQFPKALGKHPENGEEIIAANGRFGPYIKAGSETRSIPVDISLLDISLEKAVELLKEPRRRGGRAAAPANMKDLGKHPSTGAALVIKSGRYGPYVTDGTINASLPRGANPDSLTVEQAVGLLEARAAKIAESGGAPAPKRKKRSTGKKAKK